MDKKLYLLAEFDESTQSRFKAYEKLIAENGFTGRQTKGIPYHITLCSYLTEYEDGLTDLLEKIKHDFSEIPVTFSSLGLFGLNVLFLNPDMNARLIEIYDRVKEKSLSKDDSLAAHATLLIDEPENILAVLPKIAENFTKISGTIKRVSLYEFFPVRFIKRIDLNA